MAGRVPASTPILLEHRQDVDGRNKSGHDALMDKGPIS
jgi:hypothetical protein